MPVPSSPLLSSPQHVTVPPTSAHVVNPNDETALAPETPTAATGMSEKLPEAPTPSSPRLLSPQQSTAPPITAQLRPSPAVIAVADARPVGAVGVNAFMMLSSPIWPSTPAPQHTTPPPASSAHIV